MKNCTHCRYAEWQRTAAGSLHPNGDGHCRYPVKIPVLPQAFYWFGSGNPVPFGGNINRRTVLKADCAYYGENK